MVLDQSKRCHKCHKLKYFHMTLQLLRYYQNQIFQFNSVIEIITRKIFNTNFFTSLILTYVLYNDIK